ncbi:pirin-like C-terminal cupin domain-containing protein [Streptomyces sp. MA15]|uniref:pirin family protein n=1 Tax=Streptomyces sp. MA15 TaxID=3055061 RepID=UPI00339D4360
MPAVTVDDPLTLPRIPRPAPDGSTARRVATIVTARRQLEGAGSGVTHTPITYARASLTADARLSMPWNPAYSAMAYVLTGHGTAGEEERPIRAGQLAVFGLGDHVTVRAARKPSEALEVLLLGGLPIREPIAHYGPFVMNTREEILQAVEDFEKGRLGTVPADRLTPRNFA